MRQLLEEYEREMEETSVNRVMLSGKVSREAEVYQKEGGAAHAHSELEVEHRTAGGEWKKERYSLQGWHEMAGRMK